MTARPLYRWKSFWLGVLVFLGWAWARSLRNYDVASWGDSRGARGVLVSQRDSKLILTWTRQGSPAKTTFVGWAPLNVVMNQPRQHPRFPPAVSLGVGPSDRFMSATLAHWFLMLGFLVPWTAFLLWRSRVMRRLAAGCAEPPARSST